MGCHFEVQILIEDDMSAAMAPAANVNCDANC